MSAVAVQMEIEEGANSTVTDILNSLVGEEELALPRTGSVSFNLNLNIYIYHLCNVKP